MRIFKNEKERKSIGRKMFAVAICGLFLGFIGMALGAASIALFPFILGQMGGKDEDVFGTEQPKGIVDRWKSLDGKKKVAIGIGLAFLLPFIAIGIMWFGVMGSVYWVDMLFVVPIILIAGFLMFYKKERQKSTITKVLGNPIMGIIGIIMIGALVFSAGYNFYEEKKYEGKDVADIGNPLTTNPSDYQRNNTTNEVVYLVDAEGNYVLDEDGNKIPVLKEIDRVILKVVDDFFYSINYESNINQTFNANGTRVTMDDTDGQLEIPNARVSITLQSEDGTDLLSIGKVTDAQGLVMFTGVPYGNYIVNVDCGGYFKFSKETHLDESFENQVVQVHMMPIYYRVSVSYFFTEDKTFTKPWLVGIDETAEGKVLLSAAYEGGIRRSELENLRRQQSMYGWTGVMVGGLSNSMLQTSNQIQTTQTQWYEYLVWVLSPALGAALAVSATERQVIHYKGHIMTPKDIYVLDQAGNHPAYWRQLGSENNLNINTTQEQGNNTLPYSGLRERRYIYSVWTTYGTEGNTFRAQFNVTTLFSVEKVGFWGSSSTDKTIWSNVEVTWETELPSMSTEYWRN